MAFGAISPAADLDGPVAPQLARAILGRIRRRQALGDACVAACVEGAGGVTHFVTWNAKHFAGLLPVPACTPEAFLAQVADGP